MAHPTHRCSATMRQYSCQHASPSRSLTAAWTSLLRPCWQPQHPQLRPTTRRAMTVVSVVTTDRQSTASKPTGRIILESEEELRSNNTHRAIVWGCSGLLGALALHGLTDIHTPADGVATALGVVAAYLLADLGTGIYHWSVDNYGDGNTPVVGDQIAAFQGHHQRPWTITEREFCNNVHKDAGVLISRRAHGAHHKAPFEGNYCIVSGVWNELLDDGGSEYGFFRRLERAVYGWTGVAPRCWSEPNYELFDGYFKDGSGVDMLPSTNE